MTDTSATDFFRQAAGETHPRPQLPPEQEDALGHPSFTEYRRRSLDLAKRPVPGTVIWRGEAREGDPHEALQHSGVGVHWTVKPDSAFTPHPKPGQRRVLWQARVEHPEQQTVPRSHPSWGGNNGHSMDHEAEIRLHPGSSVHVEGAYVWHGQGDPEGHPVPLKPERTHPDWKWHPVGQHAQVANHGHISYDLSEPAHSGAKTPPPWTGANPHAVLQHEHAAGNHHANHPGGDYDDVDWDAPEEHWRGHSDAVMTDGVLKDGWTKPHELSDHDASEWLRWHPDRAGIEQRHSITPQAALDPSRFTYEVRPNPTGGHTLHGYVDGEHAGTLDHVVHGADHGVFVDELHTNPEHRGKGVASAMMDALHQHYPDAWMNHGTRSPDGTRWWHHYTDPAPHRNVHNIAPDDRSHGMGTHWTEHWSPAEVAGDIKENRGTFIDLGLNSEKARQVNRVTSAAVMPDFDHEEIDTGGSKRPTKIHLHALDPDTGDRMGTLTYHVPSRKADKILIEHLGTEDAHRRKGVGSALMDEMQRRHPGTPIDHGDRTPAGKAWWKGYTDGKKVTRGRTMASRRTAREFGVYGPPDRWYHASRHNLDEEGFEEGHVKPGHDEEAGKHWNSHLGIHLTSHHATATELAEGMYGMIHHVSVDMQNPKHYTSEHDLTHEVHAWASQHPSYGKDMPAPEPDESGVAAKETALRHHPRIAELGRSFRDHLHSQGHDGITYGNEYEGPRGHLCAIAAPHKATIDGAHSWDDDEMCEHLDHLPPRQASAATPVPDNTQPYEHEHPWLPRDHFFAPTKKGLDSRLFDGDRMRPEVRQHLLSLLNAFWAPRYGDSWQSWARVYLAGSEASHFLGDEGLGNGDLDILIGIHYDRAREHTPALAGLSDEEISTHLTDELRHGLNDDARMLPGPGGETGPWENTWFVINP